MTDSMGWRKMSNSDAVRRIKDHMEVHKLNEPHAFYINQAFEMAMNALVSPDALNAEAEYRRGYEDGLKKGNQLGYAEAIRDARHDI